MVSASELLLGERRRLCLAGANAVKSRIIVLSAHLTDEVHQTYEDLGVQAIFEKPFDIAQLCAADGLTGARRL